MKHVIAYLLATAAGIGLGFAFGSAYDVMAVGDSAMAPTLLKGEHVVIDFFAAEEKTLKRGDIVLIENDCYHETGESSRMLKRIVALPGERVSISAGTVWIDGVSLAGEDFENLTVGRINFTSKTVPEGTYFLLGDDLASSTDSRHETVGMVREDDILGKVIKQW